MPTQNVPNVAQIDIVMQRDAQEIRNTFHVLNAAGWNETSLSALADAVENWWTTNVAPLVSNELKLIHIICTDLTSLAGQRIDAIPNPPAPGTGEGGALPANATFAIKAGIARRGRGVQGRSFWPCLLEARVTNNELDGDYMQDIIDSMDLLKANLEGLGAGYTMVVVHRTVGGVQPPEGTTDAIQFWTVSDTVVDSQKLRLPNHKRHKRKTTP